MSDIMLGYESRNLYNRLRSEMRQMVKEEIIFAHENNKAKGLVPIPLVIGTPGVPLTVPPPTYNVLTASFMPTPWINGLKMHLRCDIEEIHIVADAPTVTVFDLWIQRPFQTVSQAASMVNGHYPALGSSSIGPRQEYSFIPYATPYSPFPGKQIMNPTYPGTSDKGPLWSSVFIEPNSLLYLYVTETDGLCGQVTFNIRGRAT